MTQRMNVTWNVNAGAGASPRGEVPSPRSPVTLAGPTPSEAMWFPAATPPPRLSMATASRTRTRPLSSLAVLSWPPLVTADAWPPRLLVLCSEG